MSKPTIHNPTNFDPTKYRVVGYLDNRPPTFNIWTAGMDSEQREALYAAHRERVRAHYAELKLLFPKSNAYRCQHCGQGNVRYVCAAEHEETKERVCFGDVCCERLDIPGRDQFKAKYIRTHAANMAAYEARIRKIREYLAANPEFAEAYKMVRSNDGTHSQNEFALDIARKFENDPSISEKQRDAFIASVHRDIEFGARRAQREQQELQARIDAGVTEVKEGRYEVTGKCVSIKDYESDFGINYKMLIVADDTTKYWVTVPSSLHVTETVGKRVTLTATWTRSEKDKFFAFGKRPAKASVVELQEVA